MCRPFLLAPWIPDNHVQGCSGADTHSRELAVHTSSQIYVLLLHFGSLISAMVGVFTPWELANVTNQGFLSF